MNDIILRAGDRALMVAPLLRGDNIVGMLVVRHRMPGEFAKNTVDLIKTFAAQSALAIQNARLFHEIEDKGRQLAEASQHKSQFHSSEVFCLNQLQHTTLQLLLTLCRNLARRRIWKTW